MAGKGQEGEELEAGIMPTMPVSVLFPGQETPVEKDIRFFHENNAARKVKVEEEKQHLLNPENTSQSPEDFKMIAVGHGDQRGRTEMQNGKLVLDYMNILCNGHIEFESNVQGQQG